MNTTIDNSKIFLSAGIFGDAAVTVPANTTYEKGTVLGLNTNEAITAYSTANDNATFVSEPTYILAQTIANDTAAPIVNTLARVFECGSVDKDKIIFVKAADATNPKVLAKMKNNGFNLTLVQQFT